MTDDFLKLLATCDRHPHLFVARHAVREVAHGWQAANLADAAPKVLALNETDNDVWVAVNAYPAGTPSREHQHIAAYRAHYCEIDVRGAPAPSLAVGPPSIVVESSPGKRHYYWLLDGAPSPASYPEYAAIQRALVHSVPGADRAATDPARVLRLPGTINHGYPPALPVARVLEMHPGRRYRADAFRAAFPQARPTLPPVARPLAPGTPFRFGRYLDSAGAPPAPGRGQRNAWVYRMACVGCRDMRLDEALVSEELYTRLLEAHGSQAYEYEKVAAIVHNAARFAHGAPAPTAVELVE